MSECNSLLRNLENEGSLSKLFVVDLFKHMCAFVCLGTDCLSIMEVHVQSILQAKVKKSLLSKRAIPPEIYQQWHYLQVNVLGT